MRDTLKGLLRSTLARFGLYLGRFPRTDTLEQHLLHLFGALRINCVLDVGAHVGEFGQELRRLGYRGRIVSFEPVAAAFNALSARCAADHDWRAHHLALGAENGTATIHLRGGATFHSFLPPSTYGTTRFGPLLESQGTEEVQVRRLEDLVGECVAGIAEPHVFLKVDTQGFDRVVLEGAGAHLAQVAGLQVELSVKPIYQGMTTSFADMVTYLQAQGFELTGLFPVSWDTDKIRLVELDCVWCRPSSLGRKNVRSEPEA